MQRVLVFSLCLLVSCTCNSGLSRVRAELELDPLSLDFGRIAPGDSKKLSLTITSRGKRALTLSSVTITGDDVFTIAPVAELSLPSGTTHTLEVQYAPRGAGAHAARLIISSDASETPEAVVPLIGTAQLGCQPVTCRQAGKNCGPLADGCGAQLECGTCSDTEACVGNVCTCPLESDTALCARLAKDCGSVTAADSCGVMRTVTCGSCTQPDVCNDNVCECPGESDTALCTRLAKDCGQVTAADTCGTIRTVACGSCALPQVCGANNVCACTPESDAALCTRLAKSCGQVSATDNCGATRTAACGTCSLPQTCGTNNVCACTSETDAAMCSRLHVTCGALTAPDSCGLSRTVGCGTCPPTWTLRQPALSPGARGYHGMVFDSARSETVVFGGSRNTTLFADTWVFDGTTWTQRMVAGPPGRRWHAMAYDSGRQRTVVFGGNAISSAVLMSDTWEWDGASWLQRTPTHSPPKRYAAAMAYDAARSRTVLFGGVSVNANGQTVRLNDTWEWDGNTWTQRITTTAPSFRDSHAAAYDPAVGGVVVFGGFGGTATGSGSGALFDTWAWNGSTWTLHVSSSPAGFNMRLAFDAQRGRLVRFGGNYPMLLWETWEWDGTSWTQPNVSTAPPSRAVPGMSYDSTRHKVVLFGGEGAGGSLADTWEYP